MPWPAQPYHSARSGSREATPATSTSNTATVTSPYTEADGHVPSQHTASSSIYPQAPPSEPSSVQTTATPASTALSPSFTSPTSTSTSYGSPASPASSSSSPAHLIKGAHFEHTSSSSSRASPSAYTREADDVHSPRAHDLIREQRQRYQARLHVADTDSLLHHQYRSPQHPQHHSHASTPLRSSPARANTLPTLLGPDSHHTDPMQGSPLTSRPSPGHSAAAATAASSSSSSSSAYVLNQAQQSTPSPERARGVKSRRASSGGSRIPEPTRGYSTDEDSDMTAAATMTSMADGGGSIGHAGPSRAAHSQRHASPATMAGPSFQDASTAKRTGRPCPSPRAEASSSSSSSSSGGAASTSFGGAAAAASGGPSSSRRETTQAQPATPSAPLPHLDLANYPAQELLKILAALLHQIASSNDRLRPANGQEDRDRKRSARKAGFSSSPNGSAATTPGLDDTMAGGGAGTSRHRPSSSITTAAMGALGTPSSTLCFHARNVPSISIESYLLRILKYCPTTNDVFLSLLVYFDRMSRMGAGAGPGSSSDSPAGAAAGLPRAEAEEAQQVHHHHSSDDAPAAAAASGSHTETHQDGTDQSHPGMRGFVIDSYNVHRLVIAGVTVASKFFSDVFYTNSRYAKVGGLPVHELNQLELQFLLLNDFRLVIPLPELQRYANQLLLYGSEGGTLPLQRVKELGIDVQQQPGTAKHTSGANQGARDGAGAPRTQRSNSSSTASGSSAAAGDRGAQASLRHSPRPVPPASASASSAGRMAQPMDRSAAAAVGMHDGR